MLLNKTRIMKQFKPISLNEVKQAYKKYKSYVYYDNSELFQRAKLAEYECDREVLLIDLALEQKLKDFCNKINASTDTSNLTKDFGAISYRLLPKTFKEDSEAKNTNNSTKSLFVTNEQVKESYTINRVIVMADVAVEWQLISTLWLMRYGCKLDALLDNSCKGNRLYLNENTNKIKKGHHLYKPYFKQYQQWRDNAVQTAQQSLSKSANVAVVNLDVQDYFYSTALDFSKIEHAIDPHDKLDLKKCNLHQAFTTLHKIYTEKITELQYPTNYSHLSDQEVILPIGLTSSYVLANYYLNDFDKQIQQLVPHSYYGRYVDDILLVVENPDFNFNENTFCNTVRFNWNAYLEKKKFNSRAKKAIDIVDRFIIERFYPILELNINNKDSLCPEIQYKIACTKHCYIQPTKTMLYYFNKEESVAILDKLKHDLELRASEFRDFPEDETDMTTFDENAYHLIYDDSDGQVRTLKDYKENRLGLSVFLAHRIFSSLRKTTKVNKEERERVLRLFRGANNLRYFRLWEKILTYFLVTQDKKSFILFTKHTLQQIEKIIGPNSVNIKYALKEYLSIALDLVLALHIEFIEKDTLNKIIDQNVGATRMLAFRNSFLIRHHYTIHPLIVFAEEPPVNLTDSNINIFDKFKSEFRKDILENSFRIPRKVKYWELCVFYVNGYLSSKYDHKNKEASPDSIIDFSGVEILEDAYVYYETLNSNYSKKFKNKLFKYNEKNGSLSEIHIGSTQIKNKSENPIIAIANTKVLDKHIESSIKGEPNFSSERYNDLSKMLKESRQAGSKLVVLPECSVPVAMIPSLARYSVKNQMAIVAGVEHWNINGIVYNFIVTILPVQIGYEKDAVVLYRLKNHYSPAEELLITGLGYNVPRPKKETYDLIHWNDFYFTSFYCFELANVEHRSLFRSKIDLMIISEWNPDTTYFSNIVGATTRDLHCYVAQVNTSQYGDSRLTQPSMSAKKDIIKIKGGQNSTVLANAIEITKLRDFQLKSYALTSQDKNFKPLPPGWDRESVKRRIKGDFVI